MGQGRRRLRQLGWGFLVAAALVAVFILRKVVAPFVMALAFTYLLEPPVSALHRRGLNRVLAIVVVYIMLGLLGAAVVLFVVPQFFRELGTLAAEIPGYVEQLARLADAWYRRYEAFPLPDGVRSAIDDGIRGLEDRSLAAIQGTVEGLISMAAGAWSLVLVPFLAFYMLKDADHFRQLLVRRLPPPAQGVWLRLLTDCDRVLSGFIRGQVLIAAIIGASLAMTAAWLQLPYALLLGVFAALGEFIPYFGPVIGSLPALIFAAGVSTSTFIKMAVAVIVIHQLEQAVLFPLILGDSTGLHPLLVIFAVLLGGHLFGLAGLIVSVPLAGILWSLWRFIAGVASLEGSPRQRLEDDGEVSP